MVTAEHQHEWRPSVKHIHLVNPRLSHDEFIRLGVKSDAASAAVGLACACGDSRAPDCHEQDPESR